MLTSEQKVVLEKFKKEGTKNFSRTDYYHLNRIKKLYTWAVVNIDEIRADYELLVS